MKRHLHYLIISLSLLLFSPSLFNYFSTDDWFHLRVSQIRSLSEFINFFSFVHNDQSIAFYRPLSTQVFFFIFQKLFGLSALPYHFFVLAAFGVSLFLVYRLAIMLLKNKNRALVALFIYGFSVSNFTRVYFLSAFQEICLVIFAILAIMSYLQKRTVLTWIFFILALLSKETAVVIPIILLILDWSNQKFNLKKSLPYLLFLIPYAFLRLGLFGSAVGDTYVWSLSPFKFINTLIWYLLWAIGAPELLVDYIGSGFKPIPRLYTDLPIWSYVIIVLLILTLITILWFLIKNIKKIDKKWFIWCLLFLFSLGPVLFLPQHKFSLELGLPLVWGSLALADLLSRSPNASYLFLISFLALNLSMNYLTHSRHYSVQRGEISKKIVIFLRKNYQTLPANSYFEFINDTGNNIQSWGSSKQIANSIGSSELFKVFYKNPSYTVYFEDFPGSRPNDETKISLSSKIFLK